MTTDEWIQILLGDETSPEQEWLTTAEDLVRSIIFDDQPDIGAESKMLLADALLRYLSKYINNLYAKADINKDLLEVSEKWAEIMAQTAVQVSLDKAHAMMQEEEEKERLRELELANLDPEARINVKGPDEPQ